MEFENLGTKFQVSEWSALTVLETSMRRAMEVEGCMDNNNSSFKLRVILLHLLKLGFIFLLLLVFESFEV